MDVQLTRVRDMRFADGAPVRAASAVARFHEGFLVAQDDATHAAWLRGEQAQRVRLLPPEQGLETFDEASGTKHLKPDLEAAFEVDADELQGVLLLERLLAEQEQAEQEQARPPRPPAGPHRDGLLAPPRGPLRPADLRRPLTGVLPR